MDERRHHQRFAFEAGARLASDKSCWSTRVLDLSLRGALVKRPTDWTGDIGLEQALRVDLPGSRRIEMQCTVAHFSEQCIGFHCERIDMDSFSHLKLVALANLGSEEALNRELTALV